MPGPSDVSQTPFTQTWDLPLLDVEVDVAVLPVPPVLGMLGVLGILMLGMEGRSGMEGTSMSGISTSLASEPVMGSGDARMVVVRVRRRRGRR